MSVEEHARFKALACMGGTLGTVAIYPLSALLADKFGWQVRILKSINKITIRIFYLIQSVFYTAGASCLLWCVVWFFLVTDDPEDHPLISEEELKVAKYRASCQFFKPFRIRPR